MFLGPPLLVMKLIGIIYSTHTLISIEYLDGVVCMLSMCKTFISSRENKINTFEWNIDKMHTMNRSFQQLTNRHKKKEEENKKHEMYRKIGRS